MGTLIRYSIFLRSALLLSMTSCIAPTEAINTLVGNTGAADEGIVGNSAIVFEPSTHSFGNLRANSASAVKTIEFTNSSKLALTLTDIRADNTHYQLLSEDCPHVLEPQESCAAVVQFVPLTSGTLSASLSVSYYITSPTSSYTASMALSGRGVTPLSFAGISNVDEVKVTSVKVHWLPDADAANYLVFQSVGAGQLLKATALAGADSAIVTGLSPNTSYTFKVQATDSLGVSTSTAASLTIQTEAAPVLASVADYSFPDDFVSAGTTMSPSLDFDNTVLGNDDDMVYTCTFDRVVDGAVDAGSVCSALEGSFSLDAASGVMSWTPDLENSGAFEFKITGTRHTQSSDSEIFVVDVVAPFSRTNLVADFDAQFSNGTSINANLPILDTNWVDISSSGTLWGATLNSSNWVDPWVGDATVENPHALRLTASEQNSVNFGTQINALDEFVISAWIKPSAVAASGSIIFGNGGQDADGFVVRQDTAGTGKLQIGVGGFGVEYEEVVQSLGPLAYWRLDESSGSVMQDLGPNDLHGNYGTGITLAATSASTIGSGTSVALSGSGSYIEVPHSSHLNLNGANGFTMSLWVYPTSTGNYRALLGKGVGSPNYCYLLAFDSGTLFPTLYMTGANAVWSNRATTAATLNAWNHIAVTFDPPTKTLQYYVNGVQAGTRVVAGSALSACASNPLEVGTMISRSYPFAGRLDEIALFDRALTQQEITSLQAATPGCKSQTSLTDDAWSFVAAHVKDSTKSVSLYINGSLNCSGIYTGELNPGSSEMHAGAAADGSAAWSGDIGDVKVFSTGDSTSIASLYSKTRPRFKSTPNIIADGNVLSLDAAYTDGNLFQGAGCSPGTWKDMSANAYAATLNNFSSCGAGSGWNGTDTALDPARLVFDGFAAQPNADYVTVPAHSNLDLTGAGLTIQMWIKHTGVGGNSGYQALLGKGTNPYNYLLAFDTNTTRPSLYMSGVNETWSNSMTTNVPTGWNHITVTFDKATRAMRYYLNGSPAGTYTTSGSSMTARPAASLEIGSMIGNTYPYKGSIGAVYLYNRPLTPTEVLANCVALQDRYDGVSCAP